MSNDYDIDYEVENITFNNVLGAIDNKNKVRRRQRNETIRLNSQLRGIMKECEHSMRVTKVARFHKTLLTPRQIEQE